MNEDLKEFFWNQRKNPFPERLLDLEKTALVLKRLEYKGKVFAGTEDWIEVSQAGKTGKLTRAMLSKPAETVTAPGSIVRKWREKRLVQLVPANGSDYDAPGSPWDTFELPGHRAYRPWDAVESTTWAPALPPTNYDHLWTPCRRYYRNWQKGDRWSELFFLPWKLCQRMPMMNEPNGQTPTLVIDLEGYLHTEMVTNAY
jgi:hypothetical protein